MDIRDVTRKGGLARAQKLSKERRLEISRIANEAKARKRSATKEKKHGAG